MKQKTIDLICVVTLCIFLAVTFYGVYLARNDNYVVTDVGTQGGTAGYWTSSAGVDVMIFGIASTIIATFPCAYFMLPTPIGKDGNHESVKRF